MESSVMDKKKQDAQAVSELRKQVNAIRDELSTVVEKRTRMVREGAEAGAATLRTNIRRQPALSMGIAALAGAVVAIALVPRFNFSRSRSRWDVSRLSDVNWDRYVPQMPQVTRADLYDALDSVQRTAMRAANRGSSSVERLIDAMSRVESKETLNDMLQKAGSWFQKAKSKTTSS